MPKYPHADFTWEQRHWDAGRHLIVGMDEVGRGAFAGPVAVGAVAVTPQQLIAAPAVADSKLVPERQRELLADQIDGWAAAWSVGVVDAADIDRLGMASALREAARRALVQLRNVVNVVDVVGVDGPVAWVTRDSVDDVTIVEAVRGGDRTSVAIAAASLVAKVWRDRHMVEQHQIWPMYGFDRHVGYGTAAHRQALVEHGLCPLHRQSWRFTVDLADRSTR